MLEDELREMFAARVQTPPAAADPAGRAIRRAQVSRRRRRTATGAMTVVAFATVLGGAVAAQGMGASATVADADRVTFQNLFGADQPVATREPQLPSMKLPVDLLVGEQLWTSDGQRVDLVHEGAVGQIAKIPDGWVYSDASAVRLLPEAADKPVTLAGRASWAVSGDGSKVAVNEQGTLTVTKVSGADRGATVASSPVPQTAAPVTFFGERVVVASDKGHDYWSATKTSTYAETWNPELLAVFGTTGSASAVGVVRGKGEQLCLVDVTAIKKGLKVASRLGCGDLVSRSLEKFSASLSPDGMLLAVATPSGLHLIDLAKARLAAAAATRADQEWALELRATCPITTVNGLVWSDRTTALAQTGDGAIFACKSDGTKLRVDLPADVQPGWTMIPTFGPGK